MQEQLTAPHRIFPDTAIELILARQVASYLALPIILTDAQGDLVFYNEPAEWVLGLRFDSTGQIPLSERVAALFLRDENGEAVPFDEVPVVQVLRTGRPVYRRMLMRGLDDVDRRIETTSFPLMRRDDTLVGALIVFWERPGSTSD